MNMEDNTKGMQYGQYVQYWQYGQYREGVWASH